MATQDKDDTKYEERYDKAAQEFCAFIEQVNEDHFSFLLSSSGELVGKSIQATLADPKCILRCGICPLISFLVERPRFCFAVRPLFEHTIIDCIAELVQ